MSTLLAAIASVVLCALGVTLASAMLAEWRQRRHDTPEDRR